MKKIFVMFIVCGFSVQLKAQLICSFESDNTPSNTAVRISFTSKPDTWYAIEQAPTPNGNWETVVQDDSSDASLATSFYTEGVFSATNSTCFFKIKEIDRTGPQIGFVFPIENEIVFDSSKPIQISISDSSNIDTDSIRLYIDDVLVDNSEVSFEDGVLTYMPASGSLGAKGQEVSIVVEVRDLNDNWSMATTKYTIASPFECLAKSMICIGDPELGSYTYQIVGDVTNHLDEVTLTYMDDESLGFANAEVQYFTEGEYVVSQVPTNSIFRKIISAEMRQDGLYVSTTNVSISEIFRGSFNTSSNLEVYDADSIANRKLLANGSRQLLGIGLDTGGVKGFSRQRTYGSDIGTAFSTVNIALNSELTVQINGACMVKGNIGLFDTDLEIFMEGEIVFTESDTLSLSATIKSYSPLDKKLPLAKTFIPVAPYVFIEVDYDLYATFDLDASVIASIGATAQQGATFCLHARRHDGEWHAYKDNWADGWVDGEGSFDAGGEVSCKIGTGLKITTLVESIVGPYISVGPFISASAGVKGDMGGTVAVERKIVAGCEGKIGVDYIGSKKPIDLSHMAIYKVLYSSTDKCHPPQFLWFPEDLSYSQNETVALIPTVYGDEPVAYTWLKDGLLIQETGKDLTFVATKDSDGVYTCIARNDYGEAREDVRVGVIEPNTIAAYSGTWTGSSKWNGSVYVSHLHICPDGSAWSFATGDNHLAYGTAKLLTRTSFADMYRDMYGDMFNDMILTHIPTNSSVIVYEADKFTVPIMFYPISARQGAGVHSYSEKWVKTSDSP